MQPTRLDKEGEGKDQVVGVHCAGKGASGVKCSFRFDDGAVLIAEYPCAVQLKEGAKQPLDLVERDAVGARCGRGELSEEGVENRVNGQGSRFHTERVGPATDESERTGTDEWRGAPRNELWRSSEPAVVPGNVRTSGLVENVRRHSRVTVELAAVNEKCGLVWFGAQEGCRRPTR
ncbi:MAG: hypothetical protein JWM49_1615 [Microbacteriaceae bacterium]|nr:hypothetical protein [Microbacteriaceae bacterium]